MKKKVIAKRAVEIARGEGLNLEVNAGELLAESCGNDMRQVNLYICSTRNVLKID
jgi:DNA polymerase III delta prime subunit